MRTFSFLILFLVGSWAWCQNGTVKPGDRVRLNCEEEPSLNRDYTITKNGLLILTFLGAVPISGLTETEAGERIALKVVEQRIVRKATVTLRIIQSTSKVVRFAGAVVVSGEAPYREGMRLSDVAAIATPTQAADLGKVSIETSTGEKLAVDYAKAIGSGELNNPLIHPGDKVFFPARTRANEIYILGAVQHPGAIPLTDGLTARAALDRSGGLTGAGDRTQVKLEHDGEQPVTINLDGPGAATLLRAGDRMVVPNSAHRRVIFVQGQVEKPGGLDAKDGLSLAEAIREAGGPTVRARLDQVTVSSRGRARSSYDVNKIMKGLTADVTLEDGDVVNVPSMEKKRGNSLGLAVGVGLLLILFGK